MTRFTVFLLVLVAAMQTATCIMSSDPKVFFGNKIKQNLTKITWAHAVNSQGELEKALSSDDIMMLEADVVIGKLNGTTNTSDIPIMAHPPATESDLSLEEFLHSVLQNNTKGIKLDFKSNEAFEQSKPILTRLRANLTVPIFLNADILDGPVNADTEPLDPKIFLPGAMETLPESILSVGWTTRYGSKYNITEGRYSQKQIQKMLDVLAENKVNQSVTYPVRAGLAAADLDVIHSLVQNNTWASNATVTIWSSEGDHVNATQLSNLIKKIGVERVYVDVPKDLWNQLSISSASTFGSMMFSTLTTLLAFMFSRLL